jgi:hypothetical protein
MQTACRVTKSVCPCGGKVTTDSKFKTTSWDWGLQMSLLLPGASFAGTTSLLSPRDSFLALWSPSAHRWIFMLGMLPYSDGQCGGYCWHCVRSFVSEANQPSIYYYTMHNLYAEISTMGLSCEQRQSHLKEIKFVLTNSWNNLSVLFSAIVPVACGA